MINIAICDDCVEMTGKLDALICEVARKRFADVDIDVFWDGKDLAETVIAGERYDIIFLDIEMEKQDGISAAKAIRIVDRTVLIIYITSHEQYMKEVFEVRPFRFMVKPFSSRQVEKVFIEAQEEISLYDFYFRYRYERVERKVLVKEILYFESNKRKVTIVTTRGNLELYGKIKDIEMELKDSKTTFLRVHQSYLINYLHVDGLAYDRVFMSNGVSIPISEDRRKRVSEQYSKIEDGIDEIF